MKKRDIVTLVVLGSIFLIILFVVLIVNSRHENIEEKTEFNKLTLVTDESVFMSVSNNINKITEYVNNNISLSFILKDEVASTEYKDMSFKADEIYVISKLNLYKYYVKGSFYNNKFEQPSTYLKDGYFILNYDINNLSYNIEVIDKDIYNNAKDEKYIFETINRNNYNRFEYTTLNNKSKAVLYFNDFINKLYTDIELTYDMLNYKNRNEQFPTLNDFKNFVSIYNNITMKEFSVKDDEIGIKDNYNNEYIFDISYVLKYSVTINKAGE